jgi:hypothetical protein
MVPPLNVSYNFSAWVAISLKKEYASMKGEGKEGGRIKEGGKNR